MTKFAWVLLPLLLATGWLLFAWWRGRGPSRLAMNVAVSLLLLLYLAITAGLGIFWVANQHLPVFDWHYLFGYATLVLVLLHLGFNFRLVWRFLTGPRQARRPAAPAHSPRASPASRRQLLATSLAVATGLGVGYFLGLQRGRAESRALNPLPGPGATEAPAVVERFHALTVHSRAGLLRQSPSVAWGNRPPPFKAYPRRPREELPAPALAPGRGLELPALGALLWHVAGISNQQAAIAFRTSPSSGALFATELYLCTRAASGLPAGIWHYDARGHALVRLRDGAPDATAMAASDVPDATAWVVATAVFARTEHKYRDRAYRYLLADLGHALENLRAAAQPLGLRATFSRRFDESRLATVLGLDEQIEGVLALVALQGSSAEVPRAAAQAQAWHWSPAPQPGTARLTEAVHQATSLRAVPSARGRPSVGSGHAGAIEGVPAGAGDAPATRASDQDEAFVLPPPLASAVAIGAVIAARRSVRRYANRPLALAALATVLHAMLRSQGPIYSTAVRLDVLTPAVDGLPAAVWRYDPARHALLRRAAAAQGLRARARRAALDQDTIGDAAAVFVLAIDRAAYRADAAGAARGYRHAFLEAGLAGERLYLAAGALGLGACAVGAFHDDEASALVGSDPRREWVVHFAALGVPA